MSPDPASADGPGDPGSLTKQTVGGLRWTFLATVATLAMQLLYTAVMGRLLEPRLFGLVASAQVVLQFGTYFSEMGLGQALIQKEELSEDEIRAAFTSSVLLGGTITGLVVLGAPALSALFSTPEVMPVVRALAFSLFLTAVGLTSGNLLRRQLRFKAIALVDIGSYVLAYLVVGMGLALSGAGVWSLVAAFLTQVGIKAIANMALARHDYRPMLAIRRLRALYAFGGRISVISGLEYIGQAIIVVIIGRNAGQGALGQYNRASLLIELPLQNLTFNLANVLFPTLSRLQAETERVRRGYLQAVRIVAALLVPLGAGIAVAAPEIVAVVLGDQWGVAATLLPALALGSSMAALSFFGGITSEALGLLNTKMALQAGYVVVLVGGLFAVPSDFLVGYTLVFMGAEFLRLLAYSAFMGRALAIPVADQVRTFLPPVAAGTAVAAGIGGTALGLRTLDAPLGVVFLGEVIAGAVVLGVMATHGPLRRIRAELRDRLYDAYDGDNATGMTRIALKALALGDGRRQAIH